MWNINLDNLEDSFCFDSMMIALLKHFGLETQLYYLKKYYSSYLSGTGSLSERLNISNETVTEILLHDLIGAELIYHEKKNIPDICSFLNMELNKCPVGVFADPYDCNWTPLYQKNHFNHYFLILNYDYTNKYCVCADIYYPDVGLIHIPIEQLFCISKLFVCLEVNPIHDLTKNKIYNFISDILLLKNQKAINKERLLFIELLEGQFDLIAEIGDVSNINTSKLLLKLKIIAEDKNTFIKGLQYVEAKYGDRVFSDIYGSLLASADKFASLRSLLIKSIIKNNLDLDKIKSIINDIYDLDIRITCILKRILT